MKVPDRVEIRTMTPPNISTTSYTSPPSHHQQHLKKRKREAISETTATADDSFSNGGADNETSTLTAPPHQKRCRIASSSSAAAKGTTSNSSSSSTTTVAVAATTTAADDSSSHPNISSITDERYPIVAPSSSPQSSNAVTKFLISCNPNSPNPNLQNLSITCILPSDILYQIFSLLTIEEIDEIVLPCSLVLLINMKERIWDGIFWRQREKLIFRDALFWNQVDDEKAISLRSLEQGYPNVYHDLDLIYRDFLKRRSTTRHPLEKRLLKYRRIWKTGADNILSQITRKVDVRFHMATVSSEYEELTFSDTECMLSLFNETGIFPRIRGKVWSDKRFWRVVVQQTNVDLSPIPLADSPLHCCPEFMLKLVRIRPSVFNYASRELKNDREWVSKCLQVDGTLLRLLPDALRTHRAMIETAFRQTKRALSHIPLTMYQRREVMLDLIVEHPFALKFVPRIDLRDSDFILRACCRDIERVVPVVKRLWPDENFFSNMQVMEKFVRQDARLFQYASESIRDNDLFVFKVVKQHFHLFQWASDRLRQSKEFVLKLVAKQHQVLPYAHDSLHNASFFEQCVRVNPFALAVVDSATEAMIVSAINSSGIGTFSFPVVRQYRQEMISKYNLQAHCPSLINYWRSSHSFYEETVAKCPQVFLFAHPLERNDTSLISRLVKTNCRILDYVSSGFNCSHELVKRELRECATSLAQKEDQSDLHAFLDVAVCYDSSIALVYPEWWEQCNSSFIFSIVLKHPSTLFNVPERLLHDNSFVRQLYYALVNEEYILPDAEKLSRKEWEIVRHLFLVLVRWCVTCLENAPKRLLNDVTFFEQILKDHGDALKYASIRIRNNTRMVGLAMLWSWSAIQYASEGVRSHPHIALNAVRKSKYAMSLLGSKLKNDRVFIHKVIAHYGLWKCFKHTSREVRRDSEFILDLLEFPKVPIEILKYADPIVKKNPLLRHHFENLSGMSW